MNNNKKIYKRWIIMKENDIDEAHVSVGVSVI